MDIDKTVLAALDQALLGANRPSELGEECRNLARSTATLAIALAVKHCEAEAVEKKRYNGWSNYETWAVNLWLTNSDDHVRELAEEAYENAEPSKTFTKTERATLDLADTLKDEVEEGAPTEDANMYTDLLNGALSEVNWYELAEHYIEDEKPTPKKGNVFCTVEHIGAGQHVVTLTETGHSFALSTDSDVRAFAANCGIKQGFEDFDLTEITECSDEYASVAVASE